MMTVYMLVGVPASGKSTWVNSQDWMMGMAYINTDMYVEAEASRQGKTYSEVFESYMPTAVHLMANDVVTAREQGLDIVWDQTSTTIESRAKKFAMLPDHEAIAVVFAVPDSVEHARRLLSRIGKTISPEVVELMIAGWQEPTREEGFTEIWRV